MGKVVTNITMSLDGFIAGPDDDVQHLFKWYFSGNTDVPMQDGHEQSGGGAQSLAEERRASAGCD